MHRHRIVLAFLMLALTACAGRLPRPEGGPGASSATAAVERFLQLAGARSYLEMGWVFGTEQGPVIEQWPRSEVEQRMHAIASVLRHDSYAIGPADPVPGRMSRAERLVAVIQDGNRSSNVPFVAVRGPGSRWYVEQVDLEALTNLR